MNDYRNQWLPEQISYCSNVHPGESYDEVRDVLTRYVARVKTERGLERMSTGLWLSSTVSGIITDNETSLNDFSMLLVDNGIDLVTINGFPYGDFHQQTVKQRVYSPAWNNPQRYDYTIKLARILAHCLPDSVDEGTISTVPIAYKTNWTPEHQKQALYNLCKLSTELHNLKQQSGRHIRVCLEMEPGCVLETTDEAIHFFKNQLAGEVKQLGTELRYIDEHLGVCYDICHQAVMFEEPAESLDRLRSAGIQVGKIQISSAMHIPHPGSADTVTLLSSYAEPKYLHQVRTVDRNNRLTGNDDLVTALPDNTLTRTNPWRVHFHVPVQSQQLLSPQIQTTQNEIRKVFDYLQQNPELHPQLEVETYTWQVLPDQLRPTTDEGLISGLKNELDWVENELLQRNLLAQDSMS